MMRSARFALLIVTTWAAFAGAARAETIALLPASGAGISGEILDSARLLLRDHLFATGKHQIVLIDGPATMQEPPAQVAAEAARRSGAQRAAVLNILRLGTTAKVRFTLYDAGDGRWVYGDALTVNGGPEQLDPALARLAKALVTGKPARDNAEIDTLTAGEANPYLKRQATKSFGVRVSNMLVFNTPASASGSDDDLVSLPGIGLFWLYDARGWLADVSVDVAGRRERAAFTVGIGGYYPFGREDLSPYVGASLKWGAVNFGGAGDNGILFQPTAGLLLGRLASTQVRIELGYFVNLFEERSESSYTTVPATPRGEGRVAHGFVLSAGVGF